MMNKFYYNEVSRFNDKEWGIFMFKYLFQGLLLGFAYVAPIGNQNLYVINAATGKSKLKAYQVALITILFDISLAISCFFGIGLLVDKFPVLKGAILFLGSAAVIYIGIGLIRASSKVEDTKGEDKSILGIIGTCFAVTWLNPQAIIDGSLLLGGIRTSLPADMAKYFIIGVCLASFTWFATLTTIVSILSNKFYDKINNAIKWINIICGSIIIFYGLKLAYSFIQFIML